MKITRRKNPLKIPHHDWRVPLSSFTRWRRITDALCSSSGNESLDILLTNLRKEGFGLMCGSFDVKFNESKEGKIDGLFMFREIEKVVKKLHNKLFHKISVESLKKYRMIPRRTLLTKMARVFLFHKQTGETKKGINYRSIDVPSNSL
jgi:hypothetical protein